MLYGATAETIGDLVFTQHGCSALHVTLRGSGENDALFGGYQVLELVNEGAEWSRGSEASGAS